jgi:tryptophan synthase alpha subunit
VGEFADAAVIGSAIVQRMEQNKGREAEAVGEFLRSLRASSRKAEIAG